MVLVHVNRVRNSLRLAAIIYVHFTVKPRAVNSKSAAVVILICLFFKYTSDCVL